jgi:hypothetical protein
VYSTQIPHHGTMLTEHGVLLFGSLLLSLLLLHHIQRLRQVWRALGNLPAHYLLVSPSTPLGFVLPRIPQVSGGADFGWRNVYERKALPGVWFSYPAHGPWKGFSRHSSPILFKSGHCTRTVPHNCYLLMLQLLRSDHSLSDGLVLNHLFRLSFRTAQHLLRSHEY